MKQGDLTPDLCDQFGDRLNVLEGQFRSFGGHGVCRGETVTIKAFEDNSLVREWVSKPGDGKVLVVDGGGSMRRAMLGDLLAAKAVENQWRGIVINGCIRDAVEIAQMPLGVFALGTHPMKTEKRGLGDALVPVRIGGVDIQTGQFIAADANGIVTADFQL